MDDAGAAASIPSFLEIEGKNYELNVQIWAVEDFLYCFHVQVVLWEIRKCSR